MRESASGWIRCPTALYNDFALDLGSVIKKSSPICLVVGFSAFGHWSKARILSAKVTRDGLNGAVTKNKAGAALLGTKRVTN